MANNTGAPLNYFLYGYGPAAKPVIILGWVFASISVAVCVVIAALLLMALMRRRPPEDRRNISREGNGLRRVYIGTGVSTLILFAMAVYALKVLNEVATPSATPALTLTVTGYDWWWKVEYEDTDPARRFVTANEIHIPVGVPVLIRLKSADVIHAFWVPQLAGKTEMIPGQTNQQWIEADTEGIYRGQCTQFCGQQHAHMGFEVVAQKMDDFRKWQQAQIQPVSLSAEPGQKVFMDNCAACHTVQGTGATGAHAPDLTHLGSRRSIAAGLLPNTSDNLTQWIAHVQELKPGSLMPDITLPPDQASALAAYLATLK